MEAIPRPKHLRLIFVLGWLFLVALPALSVAGTHLISKRTLKAPSDPNCSLTGTCDLTEIRFEEMKKRFEFSGEPLRYATYLTDIRFAYTTGRISQIENYAVVQFVKGCLFHSRLENDGRVTKSLSISRDHFGKQVVYQHRDWEVDSDSTDPIYSSDPRGTRFSLLRWNSNPRSLNAETSVWYHDQKPPHGSVFLTAMPNGAALTPGESGPDQSAQNASLEFKTCLYRTADLPRTTTPSAPEIRLSSALWCVAWDHKFIWDFKVTSGSSSGTMTRPQKIDSICNVLP